MKKSFFLLFTIIFTLSAVLGLAACDRVVFKLGFIVDGELYATVETSGDEEIRIPENPTKEGFDFGGWYWDIDVWEKPFTANSLLDAPLSSDMNVYAKWIVNTPDDDGNGTSDESNGPSDNVTDDENTDSGSEDSGNTDNGNTDSGNTDDTPAGGTENGESDIPPHTHEYTVENTDSAYFASAATCESAESYFYSCSCGEAGDKTFTVGEPLEHKYNVENTDSKYIAGGTPCTEAEYFYSCVCGAVGTETFTRAAGEHNFVSGECDKCGAYVSSEGLKFELNEDQQSYMLRGIGSFRGKTLIVDTYNGLPVTEIAPYAFQDCSVNVTDLIIGNSVEYIYSYAFEDFASLERIVIGNNVEKIYGYAFEGCANITSIDFGTGIEVIGESAFKSCRGITELNFPASLKTIEKLAFEYCHALTSVTIPDTLTSLGGGAFSTCNELVSVKLGKGLSVLETSMFSYCDKLESIVIPANIQSIGGNAFYDCDALKSVVIEKAAIGNSAFTSCDNLASVTIGRGVPNIGSSAFSSCVSLERIFIPKSVVEIGQLAFSSCKKLTIYCEVESYNRPTGWNSNWNHSKCTVIWGCED